MIVVVVVLALLLIAGQVERVLTRRDHARERTRMVNALMARTPGEFVVMERQINHAPRSEREPAQPLVGLNE